MGLRRWWILEGLVGLSVVTLFGDAVVETVRDGWLLVVFPSGDFRLISLADCYVPGQVEFPSGDSVRAGIAFVRVTRAVRVSSVGSRLYGMNRFGRITTVGSVSEFSKAFADAFDSDREEAVR